MQARSPLLILLAALSAFAATAPDIGLAQTTQPYQRAPDRASLTPAQKKAETFVAKLLARAQAARATGDYKGDIRHQEEALEALEGAYGTDHVRLVEVLTTLVQTRFVTKSGLSVAVKLQERIVGIYGNRDDVDPMERIAEVVHLGDAYLFVDDERALDQYRAAWKLRAQLASAEAADALFSAADFVRLELPPNPPGHGRWQVTVHYDVHADGHAAVSDVGGDASPALKNSVRRKYDEARFRPRIVGGEPVDTPGISFTHTYVATLR